MVEISLSHQVYEKIKQNIIFLKFPPGTLLKERDLAESMGVSRTPIRETLQRLSQEHWVISRDGKRIQVSYVTIKDAQEIEQVRNIIEFAAIDHIISCGKPRLLAGELDAIINEMKNASDQCSFMSSDLNFHTHIVSSMNNIRLIHFWNTIKDEIMRMGLLAIHDKLFTDQVVSDHELFIEALWKKDLDLLKKTMSDHLKHCYSSIFANLISQDNSTNHKKS